jgi:hypothetical protein
MELCGMVKALGFKHPGALVNAVQPLIVCKSCPSWPESLRLTSQVDGH